MKYQIWISNSNSGLSGLVKTYPFKLQAYIWCWMNGYVNKAGRFGYFLNENVRIEEVKIDN